MRQTRSVLHGSRVLAAARPGLGLARGGLLSGAPAPAPTGHRAHRFEPGRGTHADPGTDRAQSFGDPVPGDVPDAAGPGGAPDPDDRGCRRRGGPPGGGSRRDPLVGDRPARRPDARGQLRGPVRPRGAAPGPSQSQRAGHRAGRCGRRSGPGADRGRPSSAARPEGVPARGRVGSAGAEGDHDDRGGRHHGRPPGRAGHRRRPAAAVPAVGEATGGRRHHRRQPGVHPVHRRFAHPGRRLLRGAPPRAARPGLRGLRPGVAGQQSRRRLRGSGHAADLHPAAGRRPGLRRSRAHPRRGPASGGDHPGRGTGRLSRHRVDRRDPGGRAQPGRHQPAEHAAPHRPAGSRRAAPDRRRHPPAETSRSTSSW